MTASNVTSASGEASVSSGNKADGSSGQQQALNATRTINNETGQQPMKKKRNLPGTPDPDAEVIALSPRTLMATNRFICEICNKGFQRDQNLQLHRRGHNLPWKLRQRTSNEIRKRVYICPEPNCVHHDPIRALGDLTGIKKHFCRKHGEKKWKCDKCSKRYAVQSDWKAHLKMCGTREYRCDCGIVFSRRDSFITHRAFCDALAEESARITAHRLGGRRDPESSLMTGPSSAQLAVTGAASPPHCVASHLSGGDMDPLTSGGVPNSAMIDSTANMALSESGIASLTSRWSQVDTGSSMGNSALSAGPKLSLKLGSGPGFGPPGLRQMLGGPLPQAGNSTLKSPDSDQSILMTHSKGLHCDEMELARMMESRDFDVLHTSKLPTGLTPFPSGTGGIFSNLIASGGGFADIQRPVTGQALAMGMSGISNLSGVLNQVGRGNTAAELTLSPSSGFSNNSNLAVNFGSVPSVPCVYSRQQQTATAQMSATALLQKAAQMGATASNTSLLRGFGLGGDSGSIILGGPWEASRQDQARVPANSMFCSSLPPYQGMRRLADIGTHDTGHTNGSPSLGVQENSGVQDLMNSLSGGAGLFGSGMNNLPSLLGASGALNGSMTTIIGSRENKCYHNTQHDALQGGSRRQAGQRRLPSMGDLQKSEDGSYRPATLDFLGIGAACGMPGAAGGMGNTLSHRDLASITAMGSGMFMGCFSNPMEVMQTVGEGANSPVKSLDSSQEFT